MLALSLKQPWAQLVVHRQKRFETRSWKANVRGWVIVHASGSTVDAAGKAVMRSPVYAGFAAYTGVTVDHVTCGPHGTMPTHVIVGAMRILDCQPVEDVQAELSDRERTYGDFGPGRYAYRLADAVLLPMVPCQGHLRFWELAPDVLAQVEQCANREGLPVALLDAIRG